MIMDEECAPLIPNLVREPNCRTAAIHLLCLNPHWLRQSCALTPGPSRLQVRNHFSFMATLNKMSTKKPAVLQRAISRFKAVGNKGEVVEGQDVAYKVQPQVEGRIRLATRSSEC